jgi:hypothetical protein
MITASDYREVVRNTLKAFCTLTLSPSGLVLKECSYHERPDGSRWIGMPARPLLDAEGRHRKDQTTGKLLYTSIVEIKGKAERERFQNTALAAVDRLRGKL